MLQFFRKIRQQLLTENKFSKYLLYAIGEIVLVVIGILIALSINNWNEIQKTKSKAQTYLALLKEEFGYNLEMLEQVMEANKKYADNAWEISKYIGPDKPQLTEEEFASLLFGAIRTEVQYRPSSGVLDEIINSGKLGIFSNQSLRTSLSSWDGIIFKIRFQEQELTRHRYGLYDILMAKGNSRRAFYDTYGEMFEIAQSKFEKGNLDLLNSVEFENQLFVFLATSRFSNEGYYPSLKEEIDKILQLIEDELE
jgi:uncharacterized protein DUF6090